MWGKALQSFGIARPVDGNGRSALSSSVHSPFSRIAGRRRPATMHPSRLPPNRRWLDRAPTPLRFAVELFCICSAGPRFDREATEQVRRSRLSAPAGIAMKGDAGCPHAGPASGGDADAAGLVSHMIDTGGPHPGRLILHLIQRVVLGRLLVERRTLARQSFHPAHQYRSHQEIVGEGDGLPGDGRIAGRLDLLCACRAAAKQAAGKNEGDMASHAPSFDICFDPASIYSICRMSGACSRGRFGRPGWGSAGPAVPFGRALSY